MENDKNRSAADRLGQPSVVDVSPVAQSGEFAAPSDNDAISASVSTAKTLTVYARKGDQRHGIQMDSSADISELRARVAEEFSQTPENITLIYAGRILENGVTLERANIQDKHAMHVVIRQPRGNTQQQPNRDNAQHSSGHHAAGAGGTQQHLLEQMMQNMFGQFPMFMDGSGGAEVQVGAFQFGPNDESSAMQGEIPQQPQFFQQVFAFDGNRMVPISMNGSVSNAAVPDELNSRASGSNGGATAQQLIDDDLFADSSTAGSTGGVPPANQNATIHIRQEVVLVPATMLSPGEAGPDGSISDSPHNPAAQASGTNPQVREFLESHPEFTHAINNRDTLQTLQVARNPNLMREMMRNHDRALSNLESLPGGLTALERYYNEYQRPLMDAAQPGEVWSQGLSSQPNPFFPFPFFQQQPTNSASQENPTAGSDASPAAPAENLNPLPNAWGSDQQNAASVAFPPGGAFVMQAMPNSMPSAVDGTAASPGDAIAQALGLANGTRNAESLQVMGALINEALGQAEASGADQIEFNFQFAPEEGGLPGTGDSHSMTQTPMMAAFNNGGGGGDADNAVAATVPTTAGGNNKSLPSSQSTTTSASGGGIVEFPGNLFASFQALSPQEQHAILAPHWPAGFDARSSEIAQRLGAMHISAQPGPPASRLITDLLPSPTTAAMNPRIIADALRIVTDRRALAAMHVLHVVAPTIFPVDPLSIMLQLNERQQHVQELHQQQQTVQFGPVTPHHYHHQHLVGPQGQHVVIRHRHPGQGPTPHEQAQLAAQRAAVARVMAGNAGAANVVVVSPHAPAVVSSNPMSAMRNMMATTPVPPSQQQNMHQQQQHQIHAVRRRQPMNNQAMRFRDPLLLQQQRQMHGGGGGGGGHQQQQYHLHANMSALANMGFRNVDANRRALLAANGNILDAVRRLNEEIARQQVGNATSSNSGDTGTGDAGKKDAGDKNDAAKK